MSTRWMRSMTVAVAIGALIATAACHSSNDVTNPPAGGGGASNLVSSGSSPTDGDATMTASATLTVNSGGSGFDELDLSQTVGSVGHEVVVTWDTNTHAINGVQHVWGSGSTTSGFTQCAPGSAACDPTKVTVDFSGHTVTLTSQVLPDAFGGSSSSTLSGTIAW